MLVKDEKTLKVIIPRHHIDHYIKIKLAELGWKNSELVTKSGLSKGEISKLGSGKRTALSARVFYKLYTAFNDTCEEAIKTTYPNLDLTLNETYPKPRNLFGKCMETYEEVKNTIEIISTKTGIPLLRLKNLYYKTGAPEAYELILIERAVEEKPGAIFKKIYD